MADLKMVLEKTSELKWKIDSILRYSTYDECDDLGGLDINYRDEIGRASCRERV